MQNDDGTYIASGEVVTSQTVSSKVRTVETLTVRTYIYIYIYIYVYNIMY